MNIQYLNELGYKICYNEDNFNSEYDFLFIKNQKICDKFMLKYNYIRIYQNGLLISNKYAIYNESVYDIVRLNENDGHKYAKIYLKQCGLVIRFYDKQTRNTILNNYINIPKSNRVPIIKFTEYFCITKYIHKGFLDNFSIIKFLFVMYLLLYKNKLIFDLQQDNIIIDKKLNIYVVDVEAKNVFTKNELMRFYIMSYFFYWLNVIDNRMDKEFFDKLYQYDLKH